MYIIKILKKLQDSEVISDRHGIRIGVEEFYFRGNHLKLAGSRNISLIQCELINFDVSISPGQALESFVQ